MNQSRDTASADIPALKRKIREFGELIEEKNVRIARLERVRLTQYQVEKLSLMKENALKTSAENKELKQRLEELERRMAEADRHQVELKKAKASLQEETTERLSVQEQTSADVLKHSALEKELSAMRQQLVTAEMGKREAASKRKERDHEDELKFLQVRA